MSWYDDETKTLISKTLKNFNVVDGEELYLYFEDDSVAKFYHSQDCCESVNIIGLGYSNFKDHLGSKITAFLWDENDGNAEYEYESATLTDLTFYFDKDSVTVSFWGESNGYYSESVDFMWVE